MKSLLRSAALLVALLLSAPASAGERTVTLTVENMTCALCPLTVRKSLEAVVGVREVTVSYERKTAVVTYEDTKTDVQALTRATTDAGYPSKPESGT